MFPYMWRGEIHQESWWAAGLTGHKSKLRSFKNSKLLGRKVFIMSIKLIFLMMEFSNQSTQLGEPIGSE